jgi:transaldolase
MEIQDIMKALAKKGISTSMHYNSEKDQCYVDLETRAKSELHLYEDGILRGRYQYETQILAASVRHPMHIIQCAQLGADVMTGPLSAILALLKHPLTDSGLAQFLADHAKAAGK